MASRLPEIKINKAAMTGGDLSTKHDKFNVLSNKFTDRNRLFANTLIVLCVEM